MAVADKANGNAAAFGAAILRFSQHFTPAQAALLHRRITLEVLAGVVKKTPVDTGRARANWQTSIGAPAPRELDAVDKSDDGVTTVEKGDAALRQIKPFTTTYITNNLAYIDALENGHSRQAPQGMVAVTVAELTSGLSRAAVGAS